MAVIEAGLDTLYYRRCLEEQQRANANRAVLGASRNENDGWRGRIRRAWLAGLTLGAPLLLSACSPSPAPIVSPAPSPKKPDLQPVPASPESGRIGQETDCPPESFCMTIFSSPPAPGESTIPLPMWTALKGIEDKIGLVERMTRIEARGSQKDQWVMFYSLKTGLQSLVAFPTQREGEYMISFYRTEIDSERTMAFWWTIVDNGTKEEFMRLVFASPLSPQKAGEALEDYRSRLEMEIITRLKNGGVVRLTLTNPYTAQTVTLPPLGKAVPRFSS